MSEILWSQNDFLFLGWKAPKPFAATGISIDTRTLKPGDLFIALQGPSFDGNNFIDEAFAKGAVTAIKQRGPSHPDQNSIVVADSMVALHRLAQHARQRARAKIIAITGSVGKTGTKEMLRAMLSESGIVHAADSSFNNHIGVPLTLARMPQNSNFAIVEIGTNHPGEIGPLAQLVRPHVALITTVEAAHTEYFKTIKDIATEKAAIVSGLASGGTAILPKDNEYFDVLNTAVKNQGAKAFTFGTQNADAVLRDIELHDRFSFVTASLFGKGLRYKLSIPGQHIAMNSLAALLSVFALGGNMEKAIETLAHLKPYSGRGARHHLSNGTISIDLIDESYNASPAAMRASIEVLGNSKSPRKILCLGDMLELGDQSAALHRALLQPILDNKIDLVLTCGAMTKNLSDAIPVLVQKKHYDDAKSMADDLTNHLQNGDVIMVKGSAGMKMKTVVDTVLKNFERTGRV